jgi:cytochrome bd-type quinol oxidase subunit 2
MKAIALFIISVIVLLGVAWFAGTVKEKELGSAKAAWTAGALGAVGLVMAVFAFLDQRRNSRRQNGKHAKKHARDEDPRFREFRSGFSMIDVLVVMFILAVLVFITWSTVWEMKNVSHEDAYGNQKPAATQTAR